MSPEVQRRSWRTYLKENDIARLGNSEERAKLNSEEWWQRASALFLESAAADLDLLIDAANNRKDAEIIACAHRLAGKFSIACEGDRREAYALQLVGSLKEWAERQRKLDENQRSGQHHAMALGGAMQ